MLGRCYSEKFKIRRHTYDKCTVCDEWLFYPNFKKWYDDNYYEVEDEKMELDKDILHKNNKIYSPNNCIFVTQHINKLFIKADSIRGKYSIGVYYDNINNKYTARCQIFDIITKKSQQKYLGIFIDENEAFEVYKTAKEQNIKEVAGYYKDRMPEKLYNSMVNYKVCVCD